MVRSVSLATPRNWRALDRCPRCAGSGVRACPDCQGTGALWCARCPKDWTTNRGPGEIACGCAGGAR